MNHLVRSNMVFGCTDIFISSHKKIKKEEMINDLRFLNLWGLVGVH